MALETLKEYKVINGQNIHDITGPLRASKKDFIHVDFDKNTILFKVQNGPIKENGVNGCQVEDLIAVCETIIKEFNTKYPNTFGEQIYLGLHHAMDWSKKRTADREARAVEGTSQS